MSEIIKGLENKLWYNLSSVGVASALTLLYQ